MPRSNSTNEIKERLLVGARKRISPDALRVAYTTRGLTFDQCAQELGYGPGVLQALAKEYNIPARSQGRKRVIGDSQVSEFIMFFKNGGTTAEASTVFNADKSAIYRTRVRLGIPNPPRRRK